MEVDTAESPKKKKKKKKKAAEEEAEAPAEEEEAAPEATEVNWFTWSLKWFIKCLDTKEEEKEEEDFWIILLLALVQIKEAQILKSSLNFMMSVFNCPLLKLIDF